MNKKLTLLLLAVMLAIVARAGDMTITTLNHQTYEHATITAVEPDGLHITYDAGVEKIPFSNLSPELQKQYGYSPAQAAAYQNQEVAIANAVRAAQGAASAQATPVSTVNSQAEFLRKQKIAEIDKRAKALAQQAYYATLQNMSQENMVTGTPDATLSNRQEHSLGTLDALTAKYKAQLMKEAGF